MKKKITELTVIFLNFHGIVLSVKGKLGDFQRAFVSVANKQCQLMNWAIADLIVAVLNGLVKTKATRLSVKMEP